MTLPTDAELNILQVLWAKGPQTVRAVHDALGATTAYTTVLKTMQIMTEKGLVTRDESQRSHVYRPLVQATATQQQLLGDLADKAFQGSAAQVAIRALSLSKPSRAELTAVRELLDQLEAEDGEPT